MLGAGAATIVVVRIAALVVGIDIAQPRVAGVVVVAAATGEALKNAARIRPVQITARSRSKPFRDYGLSLLLRSDTLLIQPPIKAPISAIFPDHTPKL